MAEGLCLAGMAVNGGYARIAAAVSSSHFASAERQYRYPLGYGGQRTPTAQWTVTGAGCILLGRREQGPFLNAATVGAVVDYGIKDANNMGAAMAPAAYETLRAHFDDLQLSPSDYDLIVTGDLGSVGKEIILDLFRRDGVGIGGVITACTGFLAQPVSAAIIFSVGYNFSLDKGSRGAVFRLSAFHFGVFAVFCLLIQGALFLVPGVDALTRWTILLYCALPASYLAPGLGRSGEDYTVASGVCSVLTALCLVIFCCIAAITA